MAVHAVHQVFDTRKVPQTLRTEVWQSLASQFLVPLNINALAPTVEGKMHSYQRDEFKGCHLVASPHTGHRTPDQASGAGAGRYKIAIATHGRVVVQQFERSTILSPGEMTLYDTSEEYSVGSDMPFGVFIGLLPQDALDIEPELVISAAVTKLSGNQAKNVRNQLLNLNEHSTAHEWEMLSELLGRVVHSQHPRRHHKSMVPVADLVERVQTLVSDYLDDPRLSPNFLAAVLGISRRHLYAVCAEQLGPPAGYIRRQRLEYSRALLENTPTAPVRHDSIASVALACGFQDPAHFSRLFRAYYGIPPNDYRQLLSSTDSAPDWLDAAGP